MVSFNNRLRQVILLAIIILLAILLIKYFYIFLPGVLGAITLYVISSNFYFKLVEQKKWRRGWTAFAYIIFYLVIICIPLYISFLLITPKVMSLINNPVEITVAAKSFSDKIKQSTGFEPFSSGNVDMASKKIANSIPQLFTSTATVLSNLLIMFFFLYYMLINGRKLESYLKNFIPLKKKNISILGEETKMMIKANAIGIPLLAVAQGFTGALGYWIFGVNEFGLWGFLTGISSVIPVVGTGLIWIPLMVYLFAIGHTWQGYGLAAYGFMVISNVDYIARITVLKAIGNVHPLVTIIGVIVGLNMFGFWGLIFGPLLVSYFVLLVKIYRNEFNAEEITPMHIEK